MVQGNVVRDLAALNKVEVLPWDVWGSMSASPAEADASFDELIDRVADAANGDDLTVTRALYEQTDELRVPSQLLASDAGVLS